MSREPYHIPDWEIEALQWIAESPKPYDALDEYLEERARRRRHAAVRDVRDKERRTLVGAHVPRAEADAVAWVADKEGMSVTAFVRQAIREAMERTDMGRALSVYGSNINKK